MCASHKAKQIQQLNSATAPLLLNMNTTTLQNLQKQDKFCKNKVCELHANIDDMFYLNTNSILKQKVIIHNLEVNTTVIPSILTYTLIHEFHNCRGHQGCARTFNLLRRKFWWKGMRGDVKFHINNCITCSKIFLILHITPSYI